MTQEQNSDLVQKQAAEAKLDSDVHYEQVRLLFEQSPKILLISYVLASVIFVTFWQVTDHFGLSVWFVIFMTYNLARLAMVYRGIKLLPKTRESVKMGNAYAFSSLISGLLWGSLMFFMQPSWPLIYQVLLLLTMLGVCSVTILSYGVHLYSYLGLLIPIISSSAISLMLFDDENYRISVLFFLIFGFQLFSSAKSFHKNQTETLRSRFRERTLINELTNANNQLEQEIIAREQIQSELKKAKEEAEAANLAKSTFLANMSHELRTPLNAVLGFSELVARDPETTQKQSESLNIINSSGKHLLRLINDVLDMSKIESGHIKLEPKPIDLHILLEDMSDMFGQRAEAKALQFSLEIAPSLPQYLQLDANKLMQILINLLGNAVNFTRAGIIILRADGRKTDTGKWTLTFEVEDTGIGIPADKLETIFEAFVQIGHNKIKQQGTGLGLAISHQLIALMAGVLTVESTFGKGSVFRFEIPVEVIDDIKMKQPAKKTESRIVSLAAGEPEWHILVVEDDANNRRLLNIQLTSVGFNVREAVNGIEGIQQFQDRQPHLICMDMRMPEMDGYEATRHIRNLPGGKEVKILALTASAFKGQETQCLDAGCNAVLSKPYNKQDLLKALAEQLDLHCIYKETTETLSKQDVSKLVVEDLQELPKEWLDDLLAAAQLGEIETMLSLTKTLPESESETKAKLDHYIKEFKLESLIKILEENKVSMEKT
jgi:signal transduction histidine kinase/CheY-like chemotaxis protein